MLYESAALLLRDKPWYVGVLPLWLLQGRAALKRHIAKIVTISPELLPYNEELITWLRDERAKGRTVILATASDRTLATGVADHVNLFDDVIGSDGVSNLKGTAKLERMKERFGLQFAYAGDSSADLPIWAACQEAILVNPSSSTEAEARSKGRVSMVFRNERSKPKLIIKELRVYQWVKNLLVFVPLITSHQLSHLDLFWRACVGFLSFSLCASCVYVINDMTDVESDRQHHRKRNRPFASGNLSLAYAFLLAPLLFLSSFGLAAFLGWKSFVVLGIYFVITVLYSFWLKRKLLVDVFTLATLYTMRLLAGHAAYGVELSSWLLSFSMFLFLSLGFAKRASELYNLQQSGKTVTARRGYVVSDLPQVNVFGVASGFLASLVLTLYMSSENIQKLYKQPALLWLLFPLMLYWITRIWLATSRGTMDEDPILYAARDWVTRLVLVLVVLLMFLATRDWIVF